MILFFIFAIAFVAAIVLITLFSPQALPWYRPHLVLNPSEMEPVVRAPVVHRQPVVMEGLLGSETEKLLDVSLEEKISRLEVLLEEKANTLEKLQKQLAAEKSHRKEFEKVQELLNEEIQNLRKQNKELKGKTGEK